MDFTCSLIFGHQQSSSITNITSTNKSRYSLYISDCAQWLLPDKLSDVAEKQSSMWHSSVWLFQDVKWPFNHQSPVTSHHMHFQLTPVTAIGTSPCIGMPGPILDPLSLLSNTHSLTSSISTNNCPFSLLSKGKIPGCVTALQPWIILDLNRTVPNNNSVDDDGVTVGPHKAR